MEDPEEEDMKPGGGPGGPEGGGEAEVLGIDDLKDFTEAKPEYGGVPPVPGDLECQHETWVMTGAPLEVTQVGQTFPPMGTRSGSSRCVCSISLTCSHCLSVP